MQINKSKKRTRRQSSNALFDNDFASGFEDSKFDKFKPILKALVVIILLVGVIWGAVAYFGSIDTKNDINKNYTSDTVRQAEDTSTETQDIEAATADPGRGAQRSEGTTSSNSTQRPSASNNSNSTSTTKSYDPSKCEPLNSEATRLRQTADQKKAIFDNAFAARRSFDEIYSEVRARYGNDSSMYQLVAAETDRIVKAEQERLNSLQADWEDALNKGNAAYGKYQECRANL